MTKRIFKKVAEEAFLAVLVIVVGTGVFFGVTALLAGVTDPSEKASTSGVYTVTTTPTETTAPAAPTTVAPTPAPAPVVEPEPVVTEPAPAPETKAAVLPPADGSLPEGWLPPSAPGGPPTAPPQPLPPAPCLPGEGGERCAPTGG